MVQPDMKKLVAYSSVSHLGFVVLGIAAMNMQGVQGAVYQMLNHGVSTGGLFLIVGMLSDRRHTRLIAEYGGLKKIAPHLVAAFLIITLSSIGLPGLNGFVGRVPDSARRLPMESARRGVCGDRRHSFGHLHAVDVPARELRAGFQREERAASGPFAARMDGAGSDCRHDRRDGCAAEHVSSTDGAIGQPDAEPGESWGVRADSGESEFTAHN